MDATTGFRGRHALHAVHAALKFHELVHFLAVKREDHLAEAAHFRSVAFHQLMAPALGRRKMGVHAVQVAHEQRRFIAAGAGANFHDRVAGIRGIGRHKAELHLFFETRNFLFQRGNFLRRHLGHFGIVAGSQGAVFLQLALGLE